jgi:hypothetical protein
MYNTRYLDTDPDKPNSLPISVMPEGGIYTINKNKVSQLDFRATASYNHIWSVRDVETHIFSALVGMEANKADYDASQHTDYGVDYENGRNVINTWEFYKQAKEEGANFISFGRSWNRRLAYFANVNYSYKGRYVTNLT